MTYEPEQLGQSKSDLASRLRELRKRAGLTGDRLARRCNMSQSQISKFETGKKTPKLMDVERILRALDASPEVLVDHLAKALGSDGSVLQELCRDRAMALGSGVFLVPKDACDESSWT